MAVLSKSFSLITSQGERSCRPCCTCINKTLDVTSKRLWPVRTCHSSHVFLTERVILCCSFLIRFLYAWSLPFRVSSGMPRSSTKLDVLDLSFSLRREGDEIKTFRPIEVMAVFFCVSKYSQLCSLD